MKFDAAVRLAADILGQIRFAVLFSLPDVLRAIYASPSLIFNPTALSRISMAKVWIPFGNGGDINSRPDKEKLITPHATGVVLDIGAGHGYTAKYLDRAKVSKYVALEPNTLMHEAIRERAKEFGFTEADDSLLILSCGAEDTASILSSTDGQVQTIISILTLCSVPSPKQVIHSLASDVLAPGGVLLFHEHVLHPRSDVAWWQSFWTPIWGKVFDGCCLNRPTHKLIEGAVDENGESIWKEGSIWAPFDLVEGNEETLFWRRFGQFVKKGELKLL
ncbi:S-adenosyl-L-methionine-dependent methyltransferase [Roridomyces roridus]|uniref:S-adenosyl-L-methionine-dependent methyltransferase n=1 Tax=Roridomyces roridus TaxID=1738132 RepID=A0AAD7FW93_9AGAR|nr:S-adenosyl-L-methionine-dependent methyltransferase [Roridomyces roridus]